MPPFFWLFLVVVSEAFQTPSSFKFTTPRGGPLRSATETISSGLEAFQAATTTGDAVVALSKIYDAIPKGDDFDLGDPETIPSTLKIETYRAIAARVEDPQIFTSQESVDLFKLLRSELDPLRTTDLKSYLTFAPYIGGLLYIAALAVQWVLPEAFPLAYIFLAALFFGPFFFTFFLT